MYADTADYGEWKKDAATGLVFSASTMSQKRLGDRRVVVGFMLDAAGFIPNVRNRQGPASLVWLMSIVPALIGVFRSRSSACTAERGESGADRKRTEGAPCARSAPNGTGRCGQLIERIRFSWTAACRPAILPVGSRLVRGPRLGQISFQRPLETGVRRKTRWKLQVQTLPRRASS